MLIHVENVKQQKDGGVKLKYICWEGEYHEHSKLKLVVVQVM
jgi:hypothetical protein